MIRTRPACWQTAVVSVSVMLVWTPGAFASGYHFGSQSVAAQGSAHANGAEAVDPSTIFYNPAGLARLPGTQVTNGITVVIPKGSFKDTGSTDAFGNPTGGTGAGSYLPMRQPRRTFTFPARSTTT